MDWGDDPVISSHYAQVHIKAANALEPQSMGMVESLRNRRRWLVMGPDELRTSMVTPAMMLAAGAEWPKLHTTYGVDNLISLGFRWPDVVAAKVKGSHLQHFSYDQLQRLGANAACVMQCRPTARDIALLGLSADQLIDMGWTLPMLKSIGLSCDNMVAYGLPLQQWVSHFGVNDFASLGFSTYAQCAALGWRDNEIRLALTPPKPSISTNSRTLGTIRFI